MSIWICHIWIPATYAPGFPESQKDFIVEDPWYREKVGGVLTGPFIENYMMNLWYNTEVAAKVGIDVRERGMSFEDFVRYAEKLHRYNVENGTSIHFIKLASWNRIDMPRSLRLMSRLRTSVDSAGSFAKS